MIYSIYKITNVVNNKCYIGFTEDPVRRWGQHRNHRNKTSNRRIYRAMNEYGVNNFTFEVLYESDNYSHTFEVMEPHYVSEYNSYHNGYNCNFGGYGINTPEHKKKLSERMKNNNPMKNEKTRKKVSATLMGRKIGPNSEETKNKKRISKLGKNNPNFGNPDCAKPLNERIVCEHCQMEMNKGNYGRWHGKKCKKIGSLF